MLRGLINELVSTRFSMDELRTVDIIESCSPLAFVSDIVGFLKLQRVKASRPDKVMWLETKKSPARKHN